MKHGKKYQDSVKSFDKQKLYDPREGLEAVLATAKATFWFSPRATRPRKHRKPALIM